MCWKECMISIFLMLIAECVNLDIHINGQEQNSSWEMDLQKVEVYSERTLFRIIDWRNPELSMDCNNTENCAEYGQQVKCFAGKCGCHAKDYVLLLGQGCYPTANLFHICDYTEQCTAMNPNSYCNQNKRCTCSSGYYFDGRQCIFRYDGNLKAQEVYKAAVVAAACFIVAVVGIFVACIVRRSFCRREENVHHSSSTSSDVFSVSDEIAALRAVDKPPSYEEVLQIERTFYGIPPPEYTFVRESENSVTASHSDHENQWDQVCMNPVGCLPISHFASNSNHSPVFHASITTALITNSAIGSGDSIMTNPSSLPSSYGSDLTLHIINDEGKDFPKTLQVSPAHVQQSVMQQHSPSISSSRQQHCFTPPPQRLACLSYSMPLSSASAPSSPHLVSKCPQSPALRAKYTHIDLTFTQTHLTSPSKPLDSSPDVCTANLPSREMYDDLTGEANILNMSTDDLTLPSDVEISLVAYDNPAFEEDCQK